MSNLPNEYEIDCAQDDLDRMKGIKLDFAHAIDSMLTAQVGFDKKAIKELSDIIEDTLDDAIYKAWYAAAVVCQGTNPDKIPGFDVLRAEFKARVKIADAMRRAADMVRPVPTNPATFPALDAISNQIGQILGANHD